MTAGGRRRRSIGRGAVGLCALLAVLGLVAVPAQANRTVLKTAVLKPDPEAFSPPPDGQVEGACGLALAGGTIYVSDYYHRAVDAFLISSGAPTSGRIALPGQNPVFGVNTLDGVCGLARTPGGVLYANEWHEGVLRLAPSEQVFDEGESTGVAVDAAGNVYANDRTYVAVYEPSGDPVEAGGEPLLIGDGSLIDGFGLAVSTFPATAGQVYVADAASGNVKVYDPSGNPAIPIATIDPGFVSLTDAALTVDPSNGHLLVVDNAQPGFTHPKAAIYEFDSNGAFLGKLPGTPVHGAPSGIVAAANGALYVTDGNSEESNVYEYSPYSASFASPGGSAESDAAGLGGSASGASGDPLHQSGAPGASTGAGGAAGRSAAPAPVRFRGQAVLVQKGPIRVAVSGGLAPTRLPRDGVAPISVTVGGRVSSTDPENPPQLRRVSFAFNRAGRLDTRGLSRCRLTDIDPSTTRQALEACGSSRVGEGHFAANVRLPEQSPFPSAGKVVAFNGVLEGKQVIFAHIYGTEPVPTSVVLPLRIRHAQGTFATRLDASLASLTGDWGYVREISLRLGRKFAFHGERHSFLSAGCPAPKGFPGAIFPLARASFSFVGGRTLTATLTRDCTVRR
jgi:DNA-binding beta-propeller fold protein YncE